MTDEQIVKALRCWTGKTVKDAECAKCSFGEDCSLGEIVDAAEKRLNELKSENAAMRDRLNRAIELPFFQKDGEVIVLIYKNNEGTVLTETYFEDVYYDGKRGDDVAEARLEELKGEK